MAKKNNAAKKRADQRRKARVEAREHFREERGEKSNGKVHIQNVAKLAEVMKGLSDKINEAKAKRDSEIGALASESDNTSGQLPKPDYQGQGSGFIYWQWDVVSDQASVTAHYYTTNVPPYSATGSHQAGDYIVTVRMVDNAETFTAEEAKRFGESLISAYTWEKVWQNFTGEYIANNGWSNEAIEASNRVAAEKNRVERENEIVASMEREAPTIIDKRVFSREELINDEAEKADEADEADEADKSEAAEAAGADESEGEEAWSMSFGEIEELP